MKNKLKYGIKILLQVALFVAFIIGVSSCSNDFLETKYPGIVPDSDTIFITNQTTDFDLELDMQASTGNWKLFQFPNWLEINPKEGMLNNNPKVNFHFSLRKDYLNLELGYHIYPLVFDVDNKGLIDKTMVIFNFGTPEIINTPALIDVEYHLQGKYMIKNSGYGILDWRVASKPSWLHLQTMEGWLNQHEYGIWDFRIDATGLKPGFYSGVVEIESNAQELNFIIQFNFTIEKTGYYGGFKKGRFIDAKHLNSNNRVAVLLKDPNLLLLFKADSPYADTVQLYREPKYMALSEDENTLAIAYTNTEVTFYNTETFDDIATYPLGVIPVSIGFGSDRWFYYIAKDDYFSYLYSRHLDSGTVIKSKNTTSYLVPIVKIPGKNLMLSSRPGSSPESLFVFDITDGNTDLVNEYWISLNGFWLSDIGDRIFTGVHKVYGIPSYVPDKTWTMEEPPILGILDFDNDQIVNHIVNHSPSNRIYVSSANTSFSAKNYIAQFNGQTMEKQKVYTLEPSPSPDFPPGNTWWTRTLRILPSTDGTELWIIQEYPNKDYLLPNVWTIERMSVN